MVYNMENICENFVFIHMVSYQDRPNSAQQSLLGVHKKYQKNYTPTFQSFRKTVKEMFFVISGEQKKPYQKPDHRYVLIFHLGKGWKLTFTQNKDETHVAIFTNWIYYHNAYVTCSYCRCSLLNTIKTATWRHWTTCICMSWQAWQIFCAFSIANILWRRLRKYDSHVSNNLLSLSGCDVILFFWFFLEN